MKDDGKKRTKSKVKRSNSAATGGGNKVHTCESCLYSTCHRRDLKRHVLAVHKKMKPFACDMCNYSAGQKGVLTR